MILLVVTWEETMPYFNTFKTTGANHPATKEDFRSIVWRAFLRRITGITEFCPNGIKVEHTKGEYMP